MGFRYRQWTKYCLLLAVLFCLTLPGLIGITVALNDSTDVKDKRLHYIVRHWHANGTHEDDEGYLEEGDPAVTIHVKRKEGETFSGFATAAGHDAVARECDEDKPENSVLKISYDEDIHLAKVHAFYKDTNLEKEGKDLGSDETKVTADGRKQYNTSEEGLHTDKTAKGDGRDFELTLESWYVENNQSDVGMVLDASGSMAFTSNDLEPIKISEGQIKKYGKLKYIPQNEVNNILNPLYTDNSKLAYSGYTYFVYDPTDGTKEYVPIGYWNGIAKTILPDKADLPVMDKLTGYYPFVENNYRCNEAEVVKGNKTREEVKADGSKEVKVSYAPSTDKEGSVSLNNNAPSLSGTGFNNRNSAVDLVKTYNEKNHGAARLDIHPENDSFTISFAVKGKDPKPVVWIGKMDQKAADDQAWYAIYADTEKGKTKVLSGEKITTEGNDIEKDVDGVKKVETKFTPTEGWAVCTYVFSQDNGKTNVAVYINGIQKTTGFLDNIFASGGEKDSVILLGGSAWAHDFGGDNWNSNSNVRFLVDELYFYDHVLSEDDVKKLYSEMLKPALTDTIYAATAPSDEDKTMAKLQNAESGCEGWYLVSSNSNWDEIANQNLLTSKRYHGIPRNEVIFNQINEWPEGTKDPTKGNTKRYIYTGHDDFSGNPSDTVAIEKDSEWNGSIIFFIDEEGYLRCFYNTGRDQERKDDKNGILNTDEESWTQNESYCSYVYKKQDLMRIKTEALQRALGSFVTRLSEVSPKSKVSAVRFSTQNITDLSTLVLQNWTSNTMDSTGMLGLRRGDRSILDFEESDGVKQYNYSLTGGTATITGLDAYLKMLDGKSGSEDSQGKSLIIFTDGKDTADKARAVEAASKLKKKGYKIYCVMLQSAGNKISEAMTFLNDLASEKDYVFHANDVDDLTEVFTKEILNRIVNNLPGYTVQDYIDPRFDLVSAEGSVLHLNANGNIKVDGKEINVDSENGYKVHITRTIKEDAVGTVGENALLFYDKDRDMYYLQWREQTIPGCSTGAEHLNVWKTRIKVRAKEDFIGGNAVISNGNADSMNMVFHPYDDDVSSGEDDIKCKKDEETGKILQYPSRGFPRIMVNVELLKLKLENAYQKIYMGETIVPGDALSVLSSKVKEYVYYEYLERYTNWISKQKAEENQNLEEQLKAGKQIQIPYYYLPDKAGSNQAGKVQPGDQIGWLTYSWTECDKKGVPKNDAVYKPYVTKNTNSRYYRLSVSYMPMTETERRRETAKIISDKDYSTPKKTVGTEQKEIRGLGVHQTDIVRGEIIVEARVLLSDLKDLANKTGGGLKAKQSFSLVRSYKGKESSSELKITFSFTKKQLNALKADKDGYVSVFSKPSDPLPLGKYTLKVKNKTPFPFDTISARKIKNGNKHFSKTYTKERKESKYAAPVTIGRAKRSVSFYLGVPSSGNETKVNLNTQLGHAVVTYARVSASKEKPKDPSTTSLGDKLPRGRAYADRERRGGNNAPDTGDRANPIHVIILMAASAVLVIMPIKRKRQNR